MVFCKERSPSAYSVWMILKPLSTNLFLIAYYRHQLLNLSRFLGQVKLTV